MTTRDLERELARVAAALGRPIERVTSGRITQMCPACGAELGIWMGGHDFGVTTLHRRLFTFYDDHRCTPETVALFEAAERAMVRAGERMLAVTDPDLRARCESEADRMAALVDRLRKRFGA